jgi:hypothetical protein
MLHAVPVLFAALHCTAARAVCFLSLVLVVEHTFLYFLRTSEHTFQCLFWFRFRAYLSPVKTVLLGGRTTVFFFLVKIILQCINYRYQLSVKAKFSSIINQNIIIHQGT